MGTSWSEEENDSVQQQAQPVNVQGSFSGALATQRSSTNSSSPIARTNSHRINETREVSKVQPKLPHNCEAILKNNSDSPIDKSSIDKLYEQLHAGVFLNGRQKKYWVDKKGNNCFMVFSNGLKITWGENPTYWYLHNAQTSDQGLITVAQLRNVAWLEVHGRFHTSNLSPGVTYQVAFLIMLEYTCYGWDVPVNFRLTLPNGTKQEHKENLKDKPKGEWLRIPVGEFKMSPENIGEIEFSLYEYEGGNWKKGLVLKSVTIEPKF